MSSYACIAGSGSVLNIHDHEDVVLSFAFFDMHMKAKLLCALLTKSTPSLNSTGEINAPLYFKKPPIYSPLYFNKPPISPDFRDVGFSRFSS